MLTLTTILFTFILSIVICVIVIYKNKNNYTKQKNSMAKEIKVLKKKTEELKGAEECVYWPVGGVSKIKISGKGSDGTPGGTFSRMDSNSSYLMKENNIGEIFDVIMKFEGDSSIYECNEAWYLIKTSYGKYGFVWGGYKSMYVDEQ